MSVTVVTLPFYPLLLSWEVVVEVLPALVEVLVEAGVEDPLVCDDLACFEGSTEGAC